MTREPSDEAILAARLQRAYPSLSPYSSASLAQQLCAIERMQRRHAERCCSGSDGGYVRRRKNLPVLAGITDSFRRDDMSMEHDPDAEDRADVRVARSVNQWLARLRELIGSGPDAGAELSRHGDPRGAVLKVRLPGEAEAVSV